MTGQRFPTPVLVVGVGNELLGDDGAGAAVVRAVEAWHRPGVAVTSVHQLLPELAVQIARYRAVVFVDATREPGATTTDLRPLDDAATTSSVLHALTPAALMALVPLFGPAPQAWLLTVRGEQFEPGDGLSAVTMAGVRAALERLDRCLPPAP